MTFIKEPKSIKKLIKLIKKRSLIYKNKIKKRNHQEIERCWEKIAKVIKFSVPDCKSKWVSLRKSYQRYRDLGTYRQWKYANDMAFLNENKDKASIENENVILLSEEEDESMQSNVTDDTLHEKSKIQNKKPSEKIIITPIINWKNNNDISLSNQKCIKTDTSRTDHEYSEQISNNTDQEVYLNSEMNVVIESHNNIAEKEHLQSEIACTSSTNSLQVTSTPDQSFQNCVESFYDEDLIFLQGLHPDMKKLNNNRKRRFKLEVMTALYKSLDEEEGNFN